MKSTSGRRPFGLSRLWPLALALTVALAACKNDEKETTSQTPEAPAVTAEKQPAAKEARPEDTRQVDGADAELLKEMAASRQQAQSKLEPVDPEIEKRMKDPEYRKQKDAMLSKLSQVSTEYFQEGIEIRHTRKRPEWRLIDPSLASLTDPSERSKKGEALAKKFKSQVEPVLEKSIDVIVFVDASESIQVY